MLGNIEDANREAVGSFDVYFPDGGDFWTVNASLLNHFPLDDVTPFVEAKTVLSDVDPSVPSFGVIFGHAHGGG